MPGSVPQPPKKMDRTEKLSIVIPTKNRNLFLGKLLKYHAQNGFGGTILIGDASDEPELGKNKETINFFEKRLHIVHERHDPSVSLIEGANRLLESATTPFTVLSGDDDFLVPAALSRCV